MNPVPVMKLVEGIKGLETSEETLNLLLLLQKLWEKYLSKQMMFLALLLIEF